MGRLGAKWLRFVGGAALVACGTGRDVQIGAEQGGADATVPADGGGADASQEASALDSGTGKDAMEDATSESGGSGDASPPIEASADASDGGGLDVVLWLDAAKGVTSTAGPVSSWADQSAYHNDASQPTPSLQPTWMGSLIHGFPAVHFNRDAGGADPFTGAGDELVIADSASLRWGTDDFYLAVVGDFDNPVDDGGIEREIGAFFDKPGNPGLLLTGNVLLPIDPNDTRGLSFSTSVDAAVFVNTAYDDGSPHVFSAARVSGGLELRVDGVTVVASLTPQDDIVEAGQPVTIGSGASGRELRLDGDVAEIMAIRGTTSKAQRAQLDGQFLSKYGL